MTLPPPLFLSFSLVGSASRGYTVDGYNRTGRSCPYGVEQQPQDQERPPGTTAWRTVVEPASGTVAYAFSPPPPGLSPSAEANIAAEKRGGGAAHGGLRRLVVEGWSSVRAVVRPSDVRTAARALSTATPTASPSPTMSGRPPGSGGGQKTRTPASANTAAVSAAATAAAAPPSCVLSAVPDLTVVAEGAGIAVRLEDDSGTHFVPPPPRAPRPRPRQEDCPSSLSPSSLRGCSSSSSGGGHGGEEMEAEQLFPATVATGGGLGDVRSLPSEGLEFAGFRSGGGTGADDAQGEGFVNTPSRGEIRSRIGPIYNFPAQISVGEWSVSFSRVHGGGGGARPGGPPAGEPVDERDASPGSCAASCEAPRAASVTTTAATVSIATVRVVDLLQRVPCHSVFRDLLVVPRHPTTSSPSPENPTTTPLPPPASAAGAVSPGWREWLEEEEDHGPCPGGGERPLDREGRGAAPMTPPPSGDPPAGAGPRHRPPLQPLPLPPPPPPSGKGGVPAIRVTYRQVASFGNLVSVSPAASTEGSGQAAATAAPKEESHGDSGGDGAGGRIGEPGGGGRLPTNPANPSSASAGERRCSNIAVDLDHPVAVNWNPRTLVALWAVRSALAQAATGDGVADIGTSEESGSGSSEERDRRLRPVKASAGSGGPSIVTTRPVPMCSTEVRVAARRGLEVRRVRARSRFPVKRCFSACW